MIKIFPSPKRNRQFVFAPKIEYEMAAEPRTRASSVRDKLREAASSGLRFIKVVRPNGKYSNRLLGYPLLRLKDFGRASKA